jgi:uroporphyrinogen-III synthase
MNSLENRTVLLTRTPEDSAEWAVPLTAAGARVVTVPCIRTEMFTGSDVQASLRDALADADWLILTSRRGVDAIAGLIDADDISMSCLIAVVGAATAASAREKLGRIDLRGTGGTAKSLGHSLLDDPRSRVGQHCVAALAQNAGPNLGKQLEAGGARYTRVNVYRTIAQEPIDQKIPLSTLNADALIFSSPSTVSGFINQISIDCDYRAYSIGPSTSAALRAAELSVAGEAHEPSIEGIIAAIEEPENA